ncbi:hypothetical protein [Amycolatopsis sp. CA-128772]|uniref:hypothetical protein n=1 Tax=Amycolatopsis sp. CA-128772 TaxID=2073159 RepID=UPI000CD32200|nr:hypothetical protein [Amycolatopsis sp. CA-128772]
MTTTGAPSLSTTNLSELAELLLDPADAAAEATALQSVLAAAAPADTTTVLERELLRSRRALLTAIADAARRSAMDGSQPSYDVGSFLDVAEWLESGLARTA